MTTKNEVPATLRIDPITLKSEFVQTKTSKPLRICCYGSSSSETPERYLSAARSLGYILAKRGHTCVNGAGAYGCMAAMNDGADIGDGHIVGVIHEMWLQNKPHVRDGGAHPIFQSTENAAPSKTNDETTPNASTASTRSNPTTAWTGKKHEMLVAGGNDLQERKRMLVDKADALIVLPGGPGTWDELWEMACARGIGLSTLPIVCVNCDGYYDPFHEMLVRAYNDKLTKFLPHELVHFESTAEAAVKWVEAICNGKYPTSTSTSANLSLKKKASILRKSSMLHSPAYGKRSNWFSLILQYDWNGDDYVWIRTALLVTTGVALGATITNAVTRWMVKR
jgi:predicted Rossmann-fold nucleotide-binding protein